MSSKRHRGERPAGETGSDGGNDEWAMHPASDAEFAAVAAFAHLCRERHHEGEAGVAPPPPLWPMVLHAMFSTMLTADVEKHSPSHFASNAAIDEAMHIAKCNINSLRDRALVVLRKAVSIEQSPPIDRVLEVGALPLGARYLMPEYDENPQLQFNALWLLTNIASGTSEHTAAVVNHPNVLEQIVRHLGSADANLSEQAVWAVGNIAGDGAPLRDRLIRVGAVPVVAAMVDDSTRGISLARNACWTLSNLCRSKPPPEIDGIKPAIPTLVRTLRHHDSEVLIDALWACSYVSEQEDGIELLVKCGAVPLVMVQLTSSNLQVVTPATRVLGNLCSSTHDHTALAMNSGLLQAMPSLLGSPKRSIQKEAAWTLSNILADDVMNSGLLQAMPSLLGSPKRSIQKEAAWTLSNILADDVKFVNMVLNQSQLIPTVIQLLSTGTVAYEVRKELIWCLANASETGSATERAGLIAAGATEALIEAFQSVTSRDSRVASAALEGVEVLLEAMKSSDKARFHANVDALQECAPPDDGDTAVSNRYARVLGAVMDHSGSDGDRHSGDDEDGAQPAADGDAESSDAGAWLRP
eukprot:CAMPEP_0174879556 /NCGR_PEP_ID=MMETSP1114-20130205/83317_1 /TAXON_ID=312471 /ORGANISM="Neobodo designis, Strain CCAP 1951/1" /LENGTH=582 /DNA_ID=CAMNT_0016114951 /DNA_START=66 /DNA_END=1814 /DNA_ORIENTATION=-